MFKFKGKSNTDMGVVVAEESFLGKTQLRYSEIVIDGKNGSEIVELGYANYSSSLNGVVVLSSELDDVLTWLSGSGTLEFEGKITTITFLDSYEILRFNKPFSIPFIRAPFWYKENDMFSPVDNGTIHNEGNVVSQPLIKITKGSSDLIELRINDVQFIYNFKNDDYVLIDCELMDASSEGFGRNNQLEIGFEFPKLEPGENHVVTVSGDAIITFKRKDRWL